MIYFQKKDSLSDWEVGNSTRGKWGRGAIAYEGGVAHAMIIRKEAPYPGGGGENIFVIGKSKKMIIGRG